jgi:hypothetical protein
MYKQPELLVFIIHISYTILFERSLFINSLANIVQVLSKQLEYTSSAYCFLKLFCLIKLNVFCFFNVFAFNVLFSMLNRCM